MLKLSLCLQSIQLLVFTCLFSVTVESFRMSATRTWIYQLRYTMTADSSSSTTRLVREESSANIKARKKSEDNLGRFARTTRVDGLRRWVREICMLRHELISRNAESGTGPSELIGINLIIELTKELLYSGIPEQIIDLYALYHEAIVQQHIKDFPGVDYDATVPHVLPNSAMICLVVRAMIQLGDVRDYDTLLFISIL